MMMRLHCEERKNLKNFLQQKKKSFSLEEKGRPHASRPQGTKNTHAHARGNGTQPKISTKLEKTKLGGA